MGHADAEFTHPAPPPPSKNLSTIYIIARGSVALRVWLPLTVRVLFVRAADRAVRENLQVEPDARVAVEPPHAPYAQQVVPLPVDARKRRDHHGSVPRARCSRRLVDRVRARGADHAAQEQEREDGRGGGGGGGGAAAAALAGHADEREGRGRGGGEGVFFLRFTSSAPRAQSSEARK